MPRRSLRLIAGRDLYYLVVVALIAGLKASGSAALQRLAERAIGLAAYSLSRRKRQAIEANLSIALGPRLDPALLREITLSVFCETWREILGWVNVPGVELRGCEEIHRALEERHGVILWESNGLGHRRAARRALAEAGLPVHQVHGPNNLGGFDTDDSHASRVRQGVIKRFFDGLEQECVASALYLPGDATLAFARSTAARLAENGIVCLAGDGVVSRQHMPIHFLGRPRPFATGGVSLARLTHAPLLPIFCLEEAPGRIVLTIEDPIRLEVRAAREAETRSALEQYAARLEAHIRRCPRQYRNWHLLPMTLDVAREGAGA